MISRLVSFLFLIALLPFNTGAQVWYDVPNPFPSTPVWPASTNVVGITVTVVPIDGPGIFSGCNTGPFWIGAGNLPNGYKFKFSEPVPRIRVQFTNIGSGEVIRVEANGLPYYVQSGDLNDYIGSCVLSRSAAIGGKIGSLISNSGAQFELDLGVPIDSVVLYHENGLKTGTHFTFSFLGNPKVNLGAPFEDTLMCHGDDIRMAYAAIANFDPTNIFNLELSDANGSFTNPVIIGSYAASDGIGEVKGKIPDNTAMGNKYRLRIASTSPVRISNDNGFDLSINPYPAIEATSNGPVCVGDALTLSATAEVGTLFNWAGPAAFTSTDQQTTITGVTAENEGDYYAVADLFTCKSYDTVRVVIKPLPVISGLTSNTPVCVGDSIVFTAASDKDNTVFNWMGPTIGTLEAKPPMKLANVTEAYSGTYTVTGVANGCTSLPVSTSVAVKPVPAVPSVGNNGPLYMGDEIKLTGSSATPGVTYEWSGPEGFYSTEPNPTVGAAKAKIESTYKLTVIIDGCSASAQTFVRVYDDELFLMYPNPTNGVINLKVNITSSKNIPIDIVNASGQVVQIESGESIAGLMKKTIVLREDLPNGRYFIRIVEGKHTEKIKFEINR
jgi:hypothetical protein